MQMDVRAYLTELVLGASESIDLLAITAAGFVDSYPSEDMAILADQRLRLRAILTEPSSWAGDSLRSSSHIYKKMYEDLVTRLGDWGWEIRIVNRRPTSNCLIIDGQVAVVADLTVGTGQGIHRYCRIERSYVVSQLRRHFETLWAESKNVELLYEDLLLSSIPHIAGALVTASEERWTDLISYFSSHPEKMYELDPRKFEELIAELLIREEMDVELTQPSKDGGRDILAVASTTLGKHLYLVECKRYATTNKVGVSIVRSLYGVVEAERATSGIIVTTSDFTRGAIEFGKTVENRLELKNYDSLTKWLRKHGTII